MFKFPIFENNPKNYTWDNKMNIFSVCDDSK